MRQFLITILALALSTSIMASDFSFGKTSHSKSWAPIPAPSMNVPEEGNIVFSAGLGFPNISKVIFSVYSTYLGYSISGIGPFHAKAEYFFADNMGLGLAVNYVATSGAWIISDGTDDYHESLDFTSMAFNIRFNWHFYQDIGFDCYLGAGLGYKYSNYKFQTEHPFGKYTGSQNAFPAGAELTIGGRYFINDYIGIYTELGIAKSIIQGGVVVKL